MDPEQRRDWASVVFTGKVVEIQSRWSVPVSERTAQALISRNGSVPYDNVLFNVERVFKGPVYENQWVSGHGHSVSCGYVFRKGQTYTVFARETEGGYLRTGYCAGVYGASFEPGEFAFADSQPPHPGTDANEAKGYALWFLALAVPMSIAIIFFSSRYVFRRVAGLRLSKEDPSL